MVNPFSGRISGEFVSTCILILNVSVFMVSELLQKLRPTADRLGMNTNTTITKLLVKRIPRSNILKQKCNTLYIGTRLY